MPQTLLAIDTATNVCTVALAQGPEVDLRRLQVGQRHSEHVLPMVDTLLADHSSALTDCDAIAFGAGPGSFTGLRIACGIVQGLAYGAGRSVVGVSNLAALAWRGAQEVTQRNGHSRCRVLAAIDARMNEAYVGVYDIDGEQAHEVAAPALADPEAILALAQEYEVDAIAGDALVAFAGALSTYGGLQLPQATADAGAIAVLARAIVAAGGAVAPAEATPLYVRDRVALTVDERNAMRVSKTAAPLPEPLHSNGNGHHHHSDHAHKGGT
jgi:tRNA threonylcarbamoyladenosine biosynthesis protein TsaB